MAESIEFTFDLRLTPARPDLAARHLQGKYAAARYADGTRHVVAAPVTPLREAPSADAAACTEALCGESITIYELRDDEWAWGQLDADSYVGWLPRAALTPPGPAPTHKVAALSTLAFPGPSIKLPPVAHLPLGSRVAVDRVEGSFAVTERGWHVPARHLATLAENENDFVAVAERFVGTPYLWGGKTSAGVDCSGLVQVALGACGIAAHRDSDMQEGGLGLPLPASALSSLRRGDLVFWKGHVAIARDATTLLHANAFHMAVAVEPVETAVNRIAATGSAVTSIRRI